MRPRIQHKRQVGLKILILGAILVFFLFLRNGKKSRNPEDDNDNGYIDVSDNEKQNLYYKEGQTIWNKNRDSTKKVLLWTPLYKIKTWWTPGTEAFRLCPEKRCSVTTDRNQFRNSDAVVFHVIDLQKPGLQDMPKFHPHGQIWVFSSQESPYRVYLGYEEYYDLSPIDGMFNVTMTYKSNSDILDVYGWYQKKKVNYEDLPENHLQKRHKFALWFSSNCNLSHFAQDRFKFVQQLQKHMSIDIFGKCGTEDPCGKFKNSRINEWWECQKSLRRKYKFYLAFENARCEDYISEKLWWALHQGVVPIVLGPSKSNYRQLAPPGSIIHIDQFPSVTSLVKYLHHLDHNEEAYSSYYNWRKDYEVMIGSPDPPWCKLCEYLHQKNIPVKTYKMSEWFSRKSNCKSTYIYQGFDTQN